MKIIRGLANLKPQNRGNVLTIGNFDGVHLGHQRVIDYALQQAKQQGMAALLMTFEPSPQEFFAMDMAPARLTRWREKAALLAQYPIDALLCLRFNKGLAELTAEQFVTEILLQQLNIKTLIVGDDFHFGYRRAGNFALLQQLSKIHDFTVISIPAIEQEGIRVSSTIIRQLLAKGEFKTANKLLGHPYTMQGRVVKGDQRGRLIGFPTANMRLQRIVAPLHGVYAVRVHGLANKPLQGAANIGKRPTVDGSQELLEVHILDFKQTIYGRHIEIEFVAKLRDEKKFSGLEELRAQLQQDAAQARILLT